MYPLTLLSSKSKIQLIKDSFLVDNHLVGPPKLKAITLPYYTLYETGLIHFCSMLSFQKWALGIPADG